MYGCSGLMKLDTNLGGKIHRTEVLNDNKTKNFQPEFKREAADLVLDQNRTVTPKPAKL